MFRMAADACVQVRCSVPVHGVCVTCPLFGVGMDGLGWWRVRLVMRGRLGVMEGVMEVMGGVGGVVGGVVGFVSYVQRCRGLRFSATHSLLFTPQCSPALSVEEDV